MISQYGAFEVESPIMKSLLQGLENNLDKKFFIVVGEAGSGKSTMVNHINKIVFDGKQKQIFDGTDIPMGLSGSAILVVSRDEAMQTVKQFNPSDVCLLDLPNLTERKADITPFSHFFIQVLSLMHNCKSPKLTEKSIEKLIQYSWPGNFFELEIVLEKAFFKTIKSSNPMVVEPESIELDLKKIELEFTIGQKLDEVERKYILQTLYFVHQNRTKAAEILGISIRTLRNKINQYRAEGYL